MKIDRQPFDLDEVVVAWRCRRSRRTRGARSCVMSCDLPEALPLVFGDRDKIRQVMLNLLGNAVKFTPEGGKVEVTAGLAPLSAARADSARAVRVSVRDSGIGIPPEHQKRCSIRSSRSTTARRVNTAAPGWGCRSCKRLVEAHGGVVWVESDSGRGATFSLHHSARARFRDVGGVMDVSFLVERLVAIGALLLASAFFAGSETALFSLSRLQREAMATREDRASRAAARAAVASAAAHRHASSSATSSSTSPTRRWRRRWCACAFPRRARDRPGGDRRPASMLPLILFIGEMTPKSLALRLGERWARVVVGAAAAAGLCSSRRVRVVLQSVASARADDRRRAADDARGGAARGGVSRARRRRLEQEGEVQDAERRLIHNVFEFGDTHRRQGDDAGGARCSRCRTRCRSARMVEADRAAALLARAHLQHRRARPDGKRRRAGPRVVGVLLAKDLVGYARGRLEGHTRAGPPAPAVLRAALDQVRSLFREFQRASDAHGAGRRRVRPPGRPGDDGGPARGALRRDRRREGERRSGRDPHRPVAHTVAGARVSASACCARGVLRAPPRSPIISLPIGSRLRKDAEAGRARRCCSSASSTTPAALLGHHALGTQLAVVISTVTMTSRCIGAVPPIAPSCTCSSASRRCW